MLIGRGLTVLERAERVGGSLGPYALQAAIAACHARARTFEETDWVRIAALYEALAELTPSPVVATTRTYRLPAKYFGGSFYCEVTVSNGDGTGVATSSVRVLTGTEAPALDLTPVSTTPYGDVGIRGIDDAG